MLTWLRNLVPRAPFPGSKAREKHPGDEVDDSEAVGSKLQIFLQLHCLAIPMGELSTKKTKPNVEKWPESLEVMLEFWFIERGLLWNLL